MKLPGYICDIFNPAKFRYYLRNKYKRENTFAKRLGVSDSTVWKWKKGFRKPTWRNAIKMARVFNISVLELIEDNQRYVIEKLIDHLIDYLEAPPEQTIEEKDETTVKGEGGSIRKVATKETNRELKLSERGALELVEKLGYFTSSEELEKSLQMLVVNLSSNGGAKLLGQFMGEAKESAEEEEGDSEDTGDR